MKAESQLMHIHQHILDHKQHLVVNHGEYDMPPQMMLQWRDHRPIQVDIALTMDSLRNGFEQMGFSDERQREILALPMIVDAILTLGTERNISVPTVMGPMVVAPDDAEVVSVWVSMETFTTEPVATLDDVIALSGTLQRDFETNPDSKVLEMITTYVAETDALGLPEWARLSTPHRRVEGGGVEWLETTIRRSTEPLDDIEVDWMVNILCRHLTRESLS